MEELEILKVFSMTEKTLEDIQTIMSMTQGLGFVISYNDPEIHRLICQNMYMKSYIKNECVFDSSKMEDVDFLIYSGKINLYILEKPGLRILYSDDDDSNLSDSDSKDIKSKSKNKKNDKKKKEKEKEKEKEEYENDPKNMTLIRELKVKDCFGSFELNIMKQNNTKFNKLLAYADEPSKLIVFPQKTNKPAENKILSRRDFFQTQREINNKDKNNPKYYDPEIFLFDDPQKITSVIDSVKQQLSEAFNNDQDIQYSKNLMTELKREKEFMDVCDHLNTSDLKETLVYIENKYENYYTEQSILELKLGTIIQKSINNIEKGQTTLLTDMDNISHKYYDKKNNKNKNLIQLNIDNELKDTKFEDYVYDQLNAEKN